MRRKARVHGHEEVNYFKLIGYPIGWVARGAGCGHGRGHGGEER